MNIQVKIHDSNNDIFYIQVLLLKIRLVISYTFSGLYDQSLYGGASHPHPHDFHSRMQTFGFGPGHPAGLDQAAAAAQYMAAGVGVGPAGYDAMYKGMFYAVLASS